MANYLPTKIRNRNSNSVNLPIWSQLSADRHVITSCASKHACLLYGLAWTNFVTWTFLSWNACSVLQFLHPLLSTAIALKKCPKFIVLFDYSFLKISPDYPGTNKQWITGLLLSTRTKLSKWTAQSWMWWLGSRLTMHGPLTCTWQSHLQTNHRPSKPGHATRREWSKRMRLHFG